MTPNGNQPAYPSEVSIGPDPRMGLTKREAFAMAAMQGILAGCETKDNEDYVYPDWIRSSGRTNAQVVAMYSVAWADALLAELERTSKP